MKISRLFVSVCTVLVLTFSASCFMTAEKRAQNEVKDLLAQAEKGDAASQNELGLHYLSGEGVAVDPYAAAKWFQRSAEQGTAQAQYNLGLLCLHGEGVVKSLKNAFGCFLEAAKQNIPDAQFRVAVMLEKGMGTDKDPLEAALWYRKAADHGHREAQFVVGMEEVKTPETRSHGLELIRFSAEQGLARAQLQHGTILLNTGKSADAEEALRWILLAAKQGLPDAQLSAAMLYLSGGHGIRKDVSSGLAWAEKAAAQNFPEAEYFLGRLCLEGKDVDKDEPKGRALLLRAESHGIADARTLLDAKK